MFKKSESPDFELRFPQYPKKIVINSYIWLTNIWQPVSEQDCLCNFTG